MPFSFPNPRRPHPFNHAHNNNNRNTTPAAEADLRHYPLLRGIRDVNESQANAAANQRTALRAPNTPAAVNAPYNPAQPAADYPGRTQTNPFAAPPSPQTQRAGQAYAQPQPYGQPRGQSHGPLNGQVHGQPHGQARGQAQSQPLGGFRPQPPMQNNRALSPQSPPQNPQRAQGSMPQNPQRAQGSMPQAPQGAQAPPPQAPPAQALSPQDAADQFRRVNSNLPDGVRYEPIDEKTMQLLRAGAGASPTPPTSPTPPATAQAFAPKPAPVPPAMMTASPASAPAPLTPIPVPPPAAAGPSPAREPNPQAEAFERLIQDERNAHVFYSYLSGISPRSDFEASLSNIAEQCQERTRLYAALLDKLHGRQFAPEETIINTFVGFEEGVALAAMEENKSLRALSELQKNLDDNAAVKTLQNIINRKIVDHNLLQFIRADVKTRITL